MKGRAALEKALPGVDLEERLERLKKLGGHRENAELVKEKIKFSNSTGTENCSKELSVIENTTKSSTRQKRQIPYEGVSKWENNRVFYYFDASIPAANQAYIRTILNYLQARTCITFVDDATATNRIRVFDGAGCYSALGMQGGEQSLSLSPDCVVVGTVAHTFMHALGILHMHVRDDRDEYLIVDLTNVPVRFLLLTPYF
ncbi:astacin [Cooperia oncophora]